MSIYKRNNRLVFLNVVENAVKKKSWDFIISMKKNKREGNFVEKFCISLLYPIPLAKKKKKSNNEKVSHVIFECSVFLLRIRAHCVKPKHKV